MNIPTTLPFFNGTRKQATRRDGSPCVIFSPRNQLPPFQIQRPHVANDWVDDIFLVDCNGNEIDIGTYFRKSEELLTGGYTNGIGALQNMDTLTVHGNDKDIVSAIKTTTGAGDAGFDSADDFSITEGKRLYLEINLTLNSGVAPKVVIVRNNDESIQVSNEVLLVDGVNHIILTITLTEVNATLLFYNDTSDQTNFSAIITLTRTSRPKITEFTDVDYIEYYGDPLVRDAENLFIQGYNGTDASGTNYRIGIAYSEDRFTWTKFSDNPILSPVNGTWEHDNVKDPSILKVNGIYYLYYTGFNAANTTQIGLATSIDGIYWTKYADNPVVTFSDTNNVTRFPFVLFDENEANPAKKWKMWYGDENFDVGYAYSSDGITWTKFSGNPVLSRGSGGSWDDTNLLPGLIFRESGKWYFYYNGRDGTDWLTGLATFDHPEGTYTKSGNNPIIENRGSSSESLTVNLTSGNKIVTVADTSEFNVDEYVWLFDDNSNPQLNRIDTIDSGTQITLVDNATADYTTAENALIRSAYYRSISPSSMWFDHDSGEYVIAITIFQALNDLGVSIREHVAIMRSTSLDSGWTFDYSDGLILTFSAGQWDALSAENSSVITTLPDLLPKGTFYIKLTDGTNEWFSEFFEIRDIYDKIHTSLASSAINQYETLTVSGTKIISAINSAADGQVYFYPQFEIANNEVITIILYLNLNSGSLPNIRIRHTETGPVISNLVTLAEGINEITLIATADSDNAQIFISNSTNTNYSTSEIWVRRQYSPTFVKLKFSDTKDLHGKRNDDQTILYQNDFEQECWLNTILNTPGQNRIDIGDEKDGIFIPEKIVTQLKYRIIDYINRSLFEALIRLPQHDDITIIDEVGNEYTPDTGNIEVSAEWETFDTGVVTIEFDDGSFVWTENAEDIT